MTAIPASRMPPTGDHRITAIADALTTAGTTAGCLPAAYFEPGHPHAQPAELIASLTGILAQLVTGMDAEAHAATPAEAQTGVRMMDAGMDAFLHQPFLQYLQNGRPTMPVQRHTNYEDGHP